jgi:dTDP-glucose pyrophosphorylase
MTKGKQIVELSSFIIQKSASVLDAAAAIDAGGRQIVFVCDGLRLLASFSDGDLRRYILRSGDPSQSVLRAANPNPITCAAGEWSKAQAIIAKNIYIRGVPIVNAGGELISVAFPDNERTRRQSRLGVPVVIMAGGKGTRLAPYTDVLPKPLIPLGDMTITEHIMSRFINEGCDDFTMIVNYKGALIKAYFKETPCKGTLRFVDEDDFQGTGGGLKLLTGMFGGSFFLTNCDILIDADYGDILNHHRNSGALITMVCALKRISVPYGTVEIDGSGKPVRFVEKPEYPLLTNTGLYVIEPGFLDMIPDGAFIHITELIQRLIDEGKPVGVYPIGEAGWMDMGQKEELYKTREILVPPSY